MTLLTSFQDQKEYILSNFKYANIFLNVGFSFFFKIWHTYTQARISKRHKISFFFNWNIFSRTTRVKLFKLICKHPHVMYIQFCSKGPGQGYKVSCFKLLVSQITVWLRWVLRPLGLFHYLLASTHYCIENNKWQVT